MNVADSLYEQPPPKKKAERIDLAFEQMIINCGIGCLINDIDMDENDYVRLCLAFSRLLRSYK